jgi:hypothetical protein
MSLCCTTCAIEILAYFVVEQYMVVLSLCASGHKILKRSLPTNDFHQTPKYRINDLLASVLLRSMSLPPEEDPGSDMQHR